MATLTQSMGAPAIEDGAAVWRIARESGVLDTNSSYSYLLWFRDFAGTSVVAREPGGAPIGFVTGYRRPDRPGTLVIWQVAVDPEHRGRGLAGAMLDHLTARPHARGVPRSMETTISPQNTASQRLFHSFADRHRASVERELLFPAALFPDPHEAEYLYRIGPLR
ncbi:diaminobutyrate acetyltransferase [Streptomyces hygroscopicus]|uniref:diaminobutyrate acetyltransferase n=1 Tax=Streptomyces hygroscopicus TaxID=1912 RepID=UPI003408C251